MNALYSITLAVVAGLVSSVIYPYKASGDIIISNFMLTENSVSFDISGTLPNDLPVTERAGIIFVNPDIQETPGFALGSGIGASDSEFTGSHSLATSINPVSTGFFEFGDYFSVAFDDDFTIGEEISGSLTASWDVDAFDPTQVQSIDVYWGYGGIGTADTGTYLTSVAVPEPSTTGAIALSGLAFLARRWWREGKAVDVS